MNFVLHKASTRGHVNHGWLNTYHTFSFADYYNPQRVHFGTLRVINDDTIIGKNGFGMHPHKDMEIITFPLEGALEHKDSMGNVGVVSFGEIQVMSAGTGIYHSEYNANSDSPVHLLQIWVLTGKKDVEPRYSQFDYRKHLKRNELIQIVSPNINDVGAWIHQNTYISYGEFDAGSNIQYNTKIDGNGVYLFLIDGSLEINGIELNKCDGVGIDKCSDFVIKTNTTSKFLLLDVAM